MGLANQIDARNSAATVRVWAELVEIRPQSGGGQTVVSEADQARPVKKISANFSSAPTNSAIDGVARGDPQGLSRVKVAKTQAWLSKEEFAKLGYVLKKDDLVAMVERAGVPVYAISDPGEPTDLGDLMLELVKA